MHEAYQPVIDDGRGRFPEDLRVKAPRGARAAACTAGSRPALLRAIRTLGSMADIRRR
jgi:hypothetical protein